MRAIRTRLSKLFQRKDARDGGAGSPLAAAHFARASQTVRSAPPSPSPLPGRPAGRTPGDLLDAVDGVIDELKRKEGARASDTDAAAEPFRFGEGAPRRPLSGKEMNSLLRELAEKP